MFTGIIEEIGHVNNVKKGTASAILTIQAEKVLEGTHIGDSIAVNGVCLTVTGIYDNTFTADVMHETLNRSSLGKLVSGSAVNLTVAKTDSQSFSVSIIPHTACETTLSLRKVGDVVNLENDIVGKYIEKFITFEKEKPKSGITKEFLLKNGF